MNKSRILAGAFALPAFLLISAAADMPPKPPLGLPPIAWPKDNPYTQAKAELGRLLYFDRRLSADETLSCASCHMPQKGFTDGLAVSIGVKAQKGGRSAPTVINRVYAMAQFWDGRAGSLEEQAKGPIANPIEMGMTHDGVVDRIRHVAGYRPLFAKAFGAEDIDIDRMAKAIACFERTVMSGNAPYDRYQHGDKKAMTAQQIRGLDIFVNKAQCDRCHEGANFTLNSYHNLGVGMDKAEPDLGRYAVTKDARDWGAFKTPTLREIEHTGPYMHDGSLKTLDEVVEFYNKGGIPNKNLDPQMKLLHMNDQEKKDLVAFMKALSGEGWQSVSEPTAFPK
jgi:cytochrome c peroxidase